MLVENAQRLFSTVSMDYVHAAPVVCFWTYLIHGGPGEEGVPTMCKNSSSLDRTFSAF